jgi:hypothetical protein
VVTIQPKQADIDLLEQIIDLRDSAHLAGHSDKPFNLAKLNGGQSVVVSPGNAGGTNVSTFAVQRLEDLGLFRVIASKPTGMTFDLVDDFRDRLEEMRVAIGQPSRLGEAQAATERAEAARRHSEADAQDLEAKVQAAAAERAERRGAFARRVGRWVKGTTTVALGILYVGIIVLAGYFVSSNLPLALIVGVIAVAVILAVLDWLLHIDGFALAARAGAGAVGRVGRWLESFDAEP